MTYKYIKRKCGVRGCKNIGSFVLSRTRELGNSVVICKECLETGLDAVKDFKPVEKPKKKSGAPELFFSAPVIATEQVEGIEPRDTKEPEIDEAIEEPVKEEMPEQKKPAVKRGKRR